MKKILIASMLACGIAIGVAQQLTQTSTSTQAGGTATATASASSSAAGGAQGSGGANSSVIGSMASNGLGRVSAGEKVYLVEYVINHPRQANQSAHAQAAEAHNSFLNKLSADGTLVMAGNGTVMPPYAMAILRAPSLQAATKLLETDPALKIMDTTFNVRELVVTHGMPVIRTGATGAIRH